MVCRTTLAWYELIPVVSFFFLLGRCRSCKTKIAMQYPLVELASGLMFATLFLKFQDVFFADTLAFIITFKYYAFIFCILLVISVYDLKHKIIPDQLSLLFGILAFVGLFFFGGPSPLEAWHVPSVIELLSGILIALPFFLLWLVSSGRWMGFGDVKFAVGIGWLLGLSQAFSALALAFWSGAIVGIALILLSKKYKMKTEIPFAPYLVLGTFIAFILDLQIFTPF